MNDTVEIRAVFVVRKMSADGGQAMPIELGFELFRREVVSAGQFDVLDAPAFHLVERARHIGRQLGAQTVKLEAPWPFESPGGTGGKGRQ